MITSKLTLTEVRNKLNDLTSSLSFKYDKIDISTSISVIEAVEEYLKSLGLRLTGGNKVREIKNTASHDLIYITYDLLFFGIHNGEVEFHIGLDVDEGHEDYTLQQIYKETYINGIEATIQENDMEIQKLKNSI